MGYRPDNSREWTMVGAAVAIAAFTSLSWGLPPMGWFDALGFLATGSVPVAIPLFLVDDWTIGGPLVASLFVELLFPLLFLGWTVPAVFGRRRAPFRSILLFAVVALSSVAWFVAAGPEAVGRHGWGYLVRLGTLSAVTGLGSGCALYLDRRQPRFEHNLMFHGLLFLWLTWSAYPWLGELP